MLNMRPHSVNKCEYVDTVYTCMWQQLFWMQPENHCYVCTAYFNFDSAYSNKKSPNSEDSLPKQ